MRVAYLYNRPVSEGKAMDCEKTYADWTGTDRAELEDMLERHGFAEGDTLCLRAMSDLGVGQESERVQGRLADLGVSIQVMPAKENKRQRGRPTKVEIRDMKQWETCCALWYSPADADHALGRISDRVGSEVDRNWVNYRCGKRDGSEKSAKRSEMKKRLGKQDSSGS